MLDSMPSRRVWKHAPPENFGILATQRVLLVHFLTSKSTSVYAYSSQCMTMLRPLQVVIQFLVRASPKSRGGRAGLVIMSLFHFSYALTLKLHIDRFRWTQLLKGIINIV